VSEDFFNGLVDGLLRFDCFFKITHNVLTKKIYRTTSCQEHYAKSLEAFPYLHSVRYGVKISLRMGMKNAACFAAYSIRIMFLTLQI
jgi:hypothetical protein